MLSAGMSSFITAPSVMLQLLTISLVQIETQVRYNQIIQEKQHYSEYDYIVVGSGSSGATIANRLTEDPNNYVLLLEAGGEQSVISDIPGMTEALVDNPEFDWRYPSVPQVSFTGVPNDMNAGRRLGGGSAINGMIHNRGNRRDFDKWVTKYGAEGWSYQDLLPYFIKSENNTDAELVAKNPGFHGTSGPIRVSTNPNPAPFLRIHEKALNEWGFPSIDVNGATQVGTTIAQSTSADGRRSSTANMYLEPIMDRKNLNILVYSFVTRILFTNIEHGPTAIGVEYIRDGQTFTALARKEVIMCAGEVRSPQMLMVSGIGPKEHLEKFGIPVLADLPVGENLQDHPAVSIHMELKDPRLGAPGPQMSVEQMYQLSSSRTGPLAFATDLIAYMSSQNNNDTEWPNLYFYSNVQNVLDLDIQVSEMPGDPQTLREWKDYFRPYLGRFLIMSAPHVYKVRSWGTVRLQSKDPKVYPLVDPAFLRDPRDRADLIEMIKFIYKFLLHSSVSKYIRPLPKPIPGCKLCPDRLPYNCDQYIDCLIRKTGKTGYHLVGGNRMGDPHRSDVVVDPRGKVKFVNQLRVCDSSIMPELINANSYAASVVIGEKCADMIKQDNLHNQNNYLKK